MAFDVDQVEGLLQAAAAQRSTFSYSDLLGELGFRFTRPKMRAVCRTLAEVDRLCALDGEPDLAVLVVRESDGLPGQGWWVGRRDYAGAFEGAPARKYLLTVQRQAFDYWQAKMPFVE